MPFILATVALSSAQDHIFYHHQSPEFGRKCFSKRLEQHIENNLVCIYRFQHLAAFFCIIIGRLVLHVCVLCSFVQNVVFWDRQAFMIIYLCQNIVWSNCSGFWNTDSSSASLIVNDTAIYATSVELWAVMFCFLANLDYDTPSQKEYEPRDQLPALQFLRSLKISKDFKSVVTVLVVVNTKFLCTQKISKNMLCFCLMIFQRLL